MDYLSGVDIVVNRTGTFELLKYTPSLMDSVEPNSATPRDLIWASKGGGGGQFGVITAYYFEFDKLPNSPEYAMYEAATIPWKDLDSPELLRDFINTYRTACLELPLQGFTLGKLNWNGVDNKGIEHGNDIVILIQVVYGDSTSHSKANGGVDVVAIDRATAKAAIEKFFSHFENARFLKTTRSAERVQWQIWRVTLSMLSFHKVRFMIYHGLMSLRH
ncbi:hypothetical protein AT251_19915 [Enterovibrio nigricans]|nr:hypothetical protein [Enterovibrio nigricans]PKF49287.1 hypothetical protein AT251_19915 [Enterovibrio nigricans]